MASFEMKSLIDLLNSASPEDLKTIKDLLSIKEKQTTSKKTRKTPSRKSKVSGLPFNPDGCWARCCAVQDEHKDKFGKDGDKLEKHNHLGLIDFQCTGKTKNGTHYCCRHGGKLDDDGNPKPAETNICQKTGKLFLGDYGKLDQDGNPVKIPRPQNPIRVSKKGNEHKFTFLDEMDDDLDKYVKVQKSKEKSQSTPSDKPLSFKDVDWEELIASGEIESLPIKTLKLYINEFELPVKGKKSEKVQAIIEHFEENQGDQTEEEEVEEEEVHEEEENPPKTESEKAESEDESDESDESEDEEEVQEEVKEEENPPQSPKTDESEEESDESEEEEEEEETYEEIQKVKYAILDGNAYDIETKTLMGPVASTPSETDTSKWKKSARKLHKKNIDQIMSEK